MSMVPRVEVSLIFAQIALSNAIMSTETHAALLIVRKCNGDRNICTASAAAPASSRMLSGAL